MANLTPDELTQAITIGDTDLLLIYPSGGPMLACQWSVVKSLIITQIGSSYLVAANNLNDVASPSSSRTNLGLGSAATQNIGTSGANVPLLNALNQWGATQTLVTGTTTTAPLLFTAGTNLTAPVSGAIEYNGTNFFATDSSAARHTLAYLDVIAATYLTSATAASTYLTISTAATTYASLSSANTLAGLQTFSAGANITPAATPATNAVGYLGLPQSAHATNYAPALTDCGTEMLFTATGHTATIPANASVAFPIGTVLVFSVSTGSLTVAITSDSMVYVPSNGSGSRTVTAPGFLIARKVSATVWWVYGLGVT